MDTVAMNPWQRRRNQQRGERLAWLVALLGLLAAAMAQADDSGLRLTPAEVALGTIPMTGEVRREVLLTATAAVVVERALSSCPCVSVSLVPEAPLALAAGQQATLTLSMDPSSYAGTFRKTVFLQVRPVTAVATKLVRVNITGTIQEEGEPAAEALPAAEPGPAEAVGAAVIAYAPEQSWAELRDALVLFLTPDCDRCNWVRLLWLPQYRRAHPQAPVYTVDLATEHGLQLLLQVEALTQSAPHQEAPIAWTAGRLHYGTAAIADLLPAPPAP